MATEQIVKFKDGTAYKLSKITGVSEKKAKVEAINFMQSYSNLMTIDEDGSMNMKIYSMDIEIGSVLITKL